MDLVAFIVLALIIILVVATLVTCRPCVCINYMVSNYYIVAILLTVKNKGYSPEYEPLISV